jgi:hypothetical protein
MKNKILILTAVLSLSCASISFAFTATPTVAFISAGTTTDNGGGTQTITGTAPAPSISFKPSSGVVIGYAATANGPTYTLSTYHTTGTFVYATSSVDTNIYRKENAAGNASQTNVTALGVPAAPATTSTDMGPTWVAGAWTASK